MAPPKDIPGPGQESVWDYPRPPALQAHDGSVKLYGPQGTLLAESQRAYRVLETSHPPTFYIPPEDVRMKLLVDVPGTSLCEWKGQAHYFSWAPDAGEDESGQRIAWTYPRPTPPFANIAGYLSFYPSKLRCFVDGEGVKAQEGDFYGGWITSKIVGPFKGGPGTWGW